MINYNESLEYLTLASKCGSRLGLERITELLERLGNPQNKVKIIHVAGTNGKGSFAAMMTSVLHAAGYKTGGFSSPAITEITDHFRINCEEISKKLFAEIMTDIIPHCEAMSDKPTEFEILTAAAYQLFFKSGCEIAVVECGMGGATDSTNIVETPLLSVITNVSKEHTAFLGETIEEIAAHKAGIIKQGCPVVLGICCYEAYDLIFNKACEKSAPFYMTDIMLQLSVKSADLSGTVFSYGDFKDIKIPLLGSYQKDNAATVLTAVEALRENGIEISNSAVYNGMKNASWHGRFELMHRDPCIIFDGAHNPDGILKAAESIKHYFDGKVILVIGVMADKEYELYADILHDYVDYAFVVSPENPRSLDSRTLSEYFNSKEIRAFPFRQLENGALSAYMLARDRNMPLIVLGSLYMYKEIKKIIGKIEILEQI